MNGEGIMFQNVEGKACHVLPFYFLIWERTIHHKKEG